MAVRSDKPEPANHLQTQDGSVSILFIETGVLRITGLRNTLEPDPDNTGVGSFRSHPAFLEISTSGALVSVRSKRSVCPQFSPPSGPSTF